MTIQSNNLYNAAVAGIGGGIGDGRSLMPLVSIASAVEAAALAVDAAIGAVTGGGTPAQSAIVEALCFAMFSGRPAQFTTQSSYTAEATSIATAYGQLAAKISGVGGVSKAFTVTFGALTGPDTQVQTVVDAAFVGGTIFEAYMTRPSTDGTLVIACLNAFPNSAGCPDGAVDIVESSIKNYSGAAEPLIVRCVQ